MCRSFQLLVTTLVLLALTISAPPAQAGGVVSVCDEAHLLAALAGGGTVTFSCSGTITLTHPIMISADTTVDGTGQQVTISGNHTVQVFYVQTGATLNLIELTVADGLEAYGGGVGNYGTLSVTRCTFSGNRGYEYGGAIYNDNWRMVSISDSTFSDNTAVMSGGAIQNSFGHLMVSNSTFSANFASGNGGGGIYNFMGQVMVINSTFSAHCDSAIGHSAGTFDSKVTLQNTIVAYSPQECGNCEGAIEDGGGNLSYPDTTCPGINRDPKLGPLWANGGPTKTMAPRPGSAAVDAGNDAICADPPVYNLDQRGVARPVGSHCDIGAFEGTLAYTYLPILTK